MFDRWAPGLLQEDSPCCACCYPVQTSYCSIVLCCIALPAFLPVDRACGELSKLVSLRELNLSQNKALSDGGLRQLARGLGDNLASINLSYTSVTDESVATLAGMKVRRQWFSGVVVVWVHRRVSDVIGVGG